MFGVQDQQIARRFRFLHRAYFELMSGSNNFGFGHEAKIDAMPTVLLHFWNC